MPIIPNLDLYDPFYHFAVYRGDTQVASGIDQPGAEGIALLPRPSALLDTTSCCHVPKLEHEAGQVGTLL